MHFFFVLEISRGFFLSCWQFIDFCTEKKKMLFDFHNLKNDNENSIASQFFLNYKKIKSDFFLKMYTEKNKHFEGVYHQYFEEVY
jgi:hypothetical protein